jgi:hypothetical protein
MPPEQPIKSKCFVVMPFGVKPIPDGQGRYYDFDKVYRVIIQRAVDEAGMAPIRADERKGSSLIHTDMFKDLRDQAVVLADLSLHNPNVFYELGIRHVMSPRGTVLMCRAGSELPFDVKLSRVIFYKYDGESLDWDEVERVVKELRQALEEARRGAPDSPVHALLERVFPDREPGAAEAPAPTLAGDRRPDSLDAYERLVAEHWARQGQSLSDLGPHLGSVFGARALGFFCLNQDPLLTEARHVARGLYNVEQYDLANEVYRRLDAAGALGARELLDYGSSLSEVEHTVSAADRGGECQMRALDLVQARLKEQPNDPAAIDDLAHCYHMIAGLRLWKWELTRTEEDLNSAIDLLEAAVQHGERARARVDSFQLGRLAQTRLKLMLMLRVRDQDRERPDAEHHRGAILALRTTGSHDEWTVSWLRWYQAITLADGGDEGGSRRMALVAFVEDAKNMTGPDAGDIGRRQYTSLRRFIEQYSHVLRNPSLVGQVSQLLQVGHHAGGCFLERAGREP